VDFSEHVRLPNDDLASVVSAINGQYTLLSRQSGLLASGITACQHRLSELSTNLERIEKIVPHLIDEEFQVKLLPMIQSLRQDLERLSGKLASQSNMIAALEAELKPINAHDRPVPPQLSC
jgi:chromosome segregation ATPase